MTLYLPSNLPQTILLPSTDENHSPPASSSCSSILPQPHPRYPLPHPDPNSPGQAVVSEVDSLISSINRLSQQHQETNIKQYIFNKMNAQSKVPLCPTSVPLQQLTSGSITLTNFNRNQQSYTYNYEKDVQNVDKMVASVSMNSFNSQIDKAISFSIEKNKDSRTGFAFSFRTATNNHWKNMRLGFVISDRPDIELGSATYNSLSGQNSGVLTYQLQQKWKHF